MRPVAGAAAVVLAAPLLFATPSAALAASAQRMCTVADDRLDEPSGLGVTAGGYVTMNDGTDLASHRKIFFLDRRCRITREVAYPSRPRDPEDLAITPDGAVWIGDIGDNDRSRDTIAVWRLARGARSPVLYRLTYPDGTHDAEALVVTPAGRPLIITKDPLSPAVYGPTGALRAGAATPLTRLGRVRYPSTGTSNPFGLAGRALITGAALAPRGDRVAIRTYSDAFEYPVRAGDVAAALTGSNPASVPLPDEPQGEALAYSADGRSLLTISEEGRSARPPAILRYPSALAPPTPPAATPLLGAAATTEAAPSSRADRLPPLGLGLLGAAVFALVAAAVVRAAAGRR